MGKLHTFNINGYTATLLAGRIEVSVPDENVGSDILVKLYGSLQDGKILSVRINMPNKIVFITAKDKDNLLFKAEEADNKREMN